jgi:hypothetical protein
MKSTPKAGVLARNIRLVHRVLHLESTKEDVMKSLMCLMLVILASGQFSFAKELPNAPSAVEESSSMLEPVTPTSSPATLTAPRPVETRLIDKKFIGLSLVSTGSTFADSYTTLFARNNWLAGRKGVCNVEVESAYLYGTHPTVGRAYVVASVKSGGSILAAYFLRKHHSKLWGVPLAANSVISLQGVTQNMITCN